MASYPPGEALDVFDVDVDRVDAGDKDWAHIMLDCRANQNGFSAELTLRVRNLGRRFLRRWRDCLVMQARSTLLTERKFQKLGPEATGVSVRYSELSTP